MATTEAMGRIGGVAAAFRYGFHDGVSAAIDPQATNQPPDEAKPAYKAGWASGLEEMQTRMARAALNGKRWWCRVSDSGPALKAYQQKEASDD